jgi:hypothetical protein
MSIVYTKIMKISIAIAMTAVCVCVALLLGGIAQMLFFIAALIWAITAAAIAWRKHHE